MPVLVNPPWPRCRPHCAPPSAPSMPVPVHMPSLGAAPFCDTSVPMRVFFRAHQMPPPCPCGCTLYALTITLFVPVAMLLPCLVGAHSVPHLLPTFASAVTLLIPLQMPQVWRHRCESCAHEPAKHSFHHQTSASNSIPNHWPNGESE